jgi:repressor LexA
MRALTKNQSAMLERIRVLTTRGGGLPPSVRELDRSFGRTGSNGTARDLDALEHKGYIRREMSRSRALQVVRAHVAIHRPIPMDGGLFFEVVR